MAGYQEQVDLIWQIADLLRGPYRPSQYERVILPMIVLRRFDCVLAHTKKNVLAEYRKSRGGKGTGASDYAFDAALKRAAGHRFYNHSEFTFETLVGTDRNVATHLRNYINAFSANVRRIFEAFDFENEIETLHQENILYVILHRFAQVDLHPERVSNEEVGLIFESLLRRFSELSNETAGEHFTPRDVIRLMVHILFYGQENPLSPPGTVRKLLDPVCGTGGMLTEAQNYFRRYHPGTPLLVFGQDYNKWAYATAAAADMLIKQVDHGGLDDNIRLGDIFTEDRFTEEPHSTFDYLIANPPFGLHWKTQRWAIRDEHEKLGMNGRFGVGLPRVSDGSLLFLQHMISKFKPVLPEQQKYGSRLAIVLSGSTLLIGKAGSGESQIRKWIIENDWLEAIIALPEHLFYNTGIGTFIWIVTNRKESRRKGKVQLLDARALYVTLRPGFGNKRRRVGDGSDGDPNHISAILSDYARFRESAISKIIDNDQFAYGRTVDELPLRLRYEMTVDAKSRFLNACPELLDDIQAIDRSIGREPQFDWNVVRERIFDLLEERGSKWSSSVHRLFRDVFTQIDPGAAPVRSSRKGEFFEPDPRLREFKRSPLDLDSPSVGYEINFNRYFYPYRHTPVRPLEEINADLSRLVQDMTSLAQESRGIITIGIDRNVPVRYSGVPWIGDIPVHWEVVPLKEVADVRRGLKLGRDYAARNPSNLISCPYLRVANVQDGYLDLSSVATIMIPKEEAKNYALQPGDVLMNEGGDADKLGRGCIWRGEINGCLHQNHVYAVRVHKDGRLRALPAWLHLWRSFHEVRSYFSSHGRQSTNLASISMANVRELPVLLPPEDEQRVIADHIEQSTDKLNRLLDATKNVMALSRERHVALIAAAVTGHLRGQSQ